MRRIRDDLRNLGTYIAGNPGSGKSSLMQQMILWDIRQDRGVCVIDPGADLIDVIVDNLPLSCLDRVIYFDTASPVGIDFLSYRDDDERDLLMDYLVGIFSLESAPIAEPILMKIIGTLFDANRNPAIKKPENLKYKCTFLDISEFCESPRRKQEILNFCPRHRQEFWDSHRYSEKDLSPITGRMIRFTESNTIRTFLGNKSASLDLWNVIQKNQILLVNLKDTKTDFFIGSLIASKIQQAIFRRRILKGEQARTPYYLYIDECDTILKFAENDFERMLKRARKYRLCMTMANPIPTELPEKILNKLGTIGNLVLFNLEYKDALIFKHRILPYEPSQLTNMPKFRALLRTNNQVSRIKTLNFMPRDFDSGIGDYIRMRTLANYPCTSYDNTHTLMDEHPSHTEKQPNSQAAEAKADPPHYAGRASPARAVFYPKKQGRGAASKKAPANPKRHTDDQPEPEAIG